MRTVTGLTLALALGAPACAFAATPAADLQNMVAAYSGVQSVRVVEKFETGSTATVDVLPGGQYRIAQAGGEDPALILHIATQPIDGARWSGTYAIKALGHKTIEGVSANGYQINSPTNDYIETVWVNSGPNLPISAHVVTQGHQIDITYGDYNNTSLVATP